MKAWIAAAACSCAAPLSAQEPPTWQEIGAIFRDRCTVCHSGDIAPLGLKLDAYDTTLVGSWNGFVLIAGNPEESPLVRRIKGLIEPRMPMNGPPWLDESQIALIQAWVRAGMPEGEAVTIPGEEPVRPRHEGEIWFSDIEQIIMQRCVRCHSEGSLLGTPPEGLRLSSLEAILAGGERVVVVPGNAALSLMWRHVTAREEPQMPFDGPPFLTEAETDMIRDWINDGARDGEGNPSVAPVGGRLRVEGLLTSDGELDGGAFEVTPQTRVEDGLRIGSRYELRAVIGPDGGVVAMRVRER